MFIPSSGAAIGAAIRNNRLAAEEQKKIDALKTLGLYPSPSPQEVEEQIIIPEYQYTRSDGFYILGGLIIGSILLERMLSRLK